MDKQAKVRSDKSATARIMASVRGKDSGAEIALRRALHRFGVRYRLHAADVTGRPDLVIRKYRLAVFVDGDFWHGNSWRLRGYESLQDQFASNRAFWVNKIGKNIERDKSVNARLRGGGWTVIRLWE